MGRVFAVAIRIGDTNSDGSIASENASTNLSNSFFRDDGPGESHNHQGGGANYLCLPPKPKYDKYNDGNQNSGYMYGTEYEINDYSGSVLKSNLHDHDAPCAVCFVKSRGSMLMIPAHNDCPYGWTEEYHG